MSDEEDLRRLINEPSDDSEYDTAKLQEILLAHNNNLNKAAAQIWLEKAAEYTQLVDMKEGETARSLSDLQKNALAMAKLFEDKSGEDDSGKHITTVGRITRP